jgi:hypothetical protein
MIESDLTRAAVSGEYSSAKNFAVYEKVVQLLH